MKIGKKPCDLINLEIKGQLPEPRYDCSLNYYEELDLLILFGGKDKNIVILEDIFVMDLQNLQWIKARYKFNYYIRLGRAEHSSIIYENQLIVFGGITETEFVGSDFLIINLGKLFNYWY